MMRLLVFVLVSVNSFVPQQPLFTIHTELHSSAKESGGDGTYAIEYDDFLPQPNNVWDAQQVVEACMNVLLERRSAGLEVCFNFSSDACRAALGGSLERFCEYASNPVFGYLVNCDEYEIVSVGPIIEGTLTRGAMQTVLLDAKKEVPRRFLWTLRKERRPPRQDFWVIHEVVDVKYAFQLTE